MKAEDIKDLIDKKIPLTEETLSELKVLVEEYPYFQAAQLLYTLNLHAEKDSRFPAQLRKMACYLSNRKKLFFLVEDDYFSPERISKLEKEAEALNVSPFEMIDFFLSEKNEKEQTLIPDNNSDIISKDYISYFLKEETQSENIVPMQHQDVIDKFLEEDERAPIRIELKDAEEEEEDVSLEPELPDESLFLSETLAKIYIKQKKYDRALSILTQLNLRNPEKNRYFADQIRFLEILINNTKI